MLIEKMLKSIQKVFKTGPKTLQVSCKNLQSYTELLFLFFRVVTTHAHKIAKNMFKSGKTVVTYMLRRPFMLSRFSAGLV